LAASDSDSKEVDLADLNPEFRRRLGNFLTAAKAAGIPAHIIEAYRSNAVQAQYYAEKQQGLRPYPVAPPGASFHNYGAASDVLTDDRSRQGELIRYAQQHPEYGIYPLPGDAPHFQIAGYRNVADLQARPPTLGEGASVDLAPFIATNQGYSIGKGYAGGVGGPAGPLAPSNTALAQRGTAAEHAAFIRDYAKQIGLNPDLAIGIANAEGLNAWRGNPGAQSYVTKNGVREPSFGDFQLLMRPGGIGAQALEAGIDPRDPTQWKLADAYAMNRMQAEGVRPWTDPYARNYLATGQTPGTTINTGGGPLAGSQTGTVSPGPMAAAGSTYGPPGLNTGASQPLLGFTTGSPAEQNFLKGAEALTGQKFAGDQKPGQQQDQSQSRAPEPPRPPDMPPIPARNVSPFLGGPPGQPNPQAIMQAAASSSPMPLSWGSGPLGRAPWLNVHQEAGEQAAQALAQLNSLVYPQSYGMSMASSPVTGGGFDYGGWV